MEDDYPLRKAIAHLGIMKYYVLVVLLCFLGFIAAELRGYRLLGDSLDTKEQHTTAGGQHFYHK